MITDVRGQIPRANWEIGRFGPKTSITVHWNGPAVPTDADPLSVIKADAAFHINKDWGGINGDGIMYHFLIAPDGEIFQTRDEDAVLFHCGNATGNVRSYAVQVMVGEGQAVTTEQYLSLEFLILHLGLDDVKPHRAWSVTQCPGAELTNWVLRRGWEDAMTPEQFQALLRKMDAIADASAIYAARVQRQVDVVTGKPYDPVKNGVDPAQEVLALRNGG